MNKAFSNFWIIVIVIALLAGGIFAWQYFIRPRGRIEILREKEYAQFALTFYPEEKMDFRAKTVFITEKVNEGVPYILIFLFGEPSDATSLDEILDQVRGIELRTKEFKGVVYMSVKKPDVIPQNIICNLDDNPPLCGISMAKGSYQINEGYSMSFGTAKFYFRENDIIEGEIDVNYSGSSISGNFRVKNQEGIALIGEKKEIEEAEKKLKELKEKEKQEEKERILARDKVRVSDMRIISMALNMRYDDEKKYLQSKVMPDFINQYLVPVPRDPLTGNSYHWLDNTSGAVTACDEQHYCVWAVLEEGGFQAASEKGNLKLNAQPTKCPCW